MFEHINTNLSFPAEQRFLVGSKKFVHQVTQMPIQELQPRFSQQSKKNGKLWRKRDPRQFRHVNRLKESNPKLMPKSNSIDFIDLTKFNLPQRIQKKNSMSQSSGVHLNVSTSNLSMENLQYQYQFSKPVKRHSKYKSKVDDSPEKRPAKLSKAQREEKRVRKKGVQNTAQNELQSNITSMINSNSKANAINHINKSQQNQTLSKKVKELQSIIQGKKINSQTQENPQGLLVKLNPHSSMVMNKSKSKGIQVVQGSPLEKVQTKENVSFSFT